MILKYKNISPKIDETAFVAQTAAVIGDVEMGPGSSVWFGCTVRGDVERIRIGRDTNVQDNSVIHTTSARDGAPGIPTLIGDGVTIGHGAILHACTLEDGCFIGMQALVMDGVVVESGAMVAAGALVPPGKRVRKGELWGGRPAKPMRPMRQAEIDWIPRSAVHYAKLAADYRD